MSDQQQENPVALVDRLAYVLREWECSHAHWAQPHINGSEVDPETGEKWPLDKTECECQHCKDARVVLADYDKHE